MYKRQGLDFSDLIDYMAEKNYTGLENLAGIPGSVGGLVFMNGGAPVSYTHLDVYKRQFQY